METEILDFSLCLIEYCSIYIFLHNLLITRLKSSVPTIIVAVINSIMVFLMPGFSAFKVSLCVISVFIGASIVFKAKPYICSAFSITLL